MPPEGAGELDFAHRELFDAGARSELVGAGHQKLPLAPSQPGPRSRARSGAGVGFARPLKSVKKRPITAVPTPTMAVAPKSTFVRDCLLFPSSSPAWVGC